MSWPKVKWSHKKFVIKGMSIHQIFHYIKFNILLILTTNNNKLVDEMLKFIPKDSIWALMHFLESIKDNLKWFHIKSQKIQWIFCFQLSHAGDGNLLFQFYLIQLIKYLSISINMDDISSNLTKCKEILDLTKLNINLHYLS